MNWTLSDVQAGWIWKTQRNHRSNCKPPLAYKKAKEFQKKKKKSTSAQLTTLKPLTMWITIKCGKFLKRGEHHTILLVPEKTVHSKKAKLVLDMEQQFEIWKGICQGCIFSLCLFNFYAEYIMWSARLDEARAGIKITRRNINNLRYADDIL